MKRIHDRLTPLWMAIVIGSLCFCMATARAQTDYPAISIPVRSYGQRVESIVKDGGAWYPVDCGIASAAMVEAYYSGFASESDQVYRAIVNACGGYGLAYRKIGYVQYGNWSNAFSAMATSGDLAAIYDELNAGRPVLIYRMTATGSGHFGVIYGYNGSATALSAEGFLVRSPYGGFRDSVNKVGYTNGTGNMTLAAFPTWATSADYSSYQLFFRRGGIAIAGGTLTQTQFPSLAAENITDVDATLNSTLKFANNGVKLTEFGAFLSADANAVQGAVRGAPNGAAAVAKTGDLSSAVVGEDRVAEASFTASGSVAGALGFEAALDPGTTYHFKFYAVVDGNVTYSKVENFTTLAYDRAFTFVVGEGGHAEYGVSGQIPANARMYLTVVADQGYQFAGYASSNGGSFADAASAATVFTMPNNDTTVTASFTRVAYRLTVAAAQGGTIDPDPSGAYAAGSQITLKAVPAEGYAFAGWTATGGLLADASATNTVYTMPVGDATVTAAFKGKPLVLKAVTPSQTTAVTGDAVTWTVGAEGGGAAKQYSYKLYKGSAVINTPAWGSQPTFTYTLLGEGSYALSVTVKDGSTLVTKTSPVTKVYTPLSIAAVTPSSTSVATGASVTWTVSATGGNSALQYSYKLYRGSTVVNTPAWVNTPTFTYALADAGSYALSVTVRDATKSLSKTSAVTTAAQPMAITAVTPSSTAIATGKAITWTVNATGGSGVKEYFYKLYQGSTVVNTPAWVKTATFTYTPTVAASYALSVTVRDASATVAKTSPVTKVVNALSITAVTPSATTAAIGATLTWTVNTSGGEAGKQYYYKLYMGGTVVNTPAWVSSATFSYKPSVAASYALSVSVRDTVTTASKTSPVTKVILPLTVTAVTPSTTATTTGKEITWTVTAEGGDGALQYYYKLYRGNTVVNTPAWGSQATFTFTLTAADNYALSVSVKDSSTTVAKTSAVTRVALTTYLSNTVSIGE